MGAFGFKQVHIENLTTNSKSYKDLVADPIAIASFYFSGMFVFMQHTPFH